MLKQYVEKEKFKIDRDIKSVFELPISLRKKIYTDIIELSPKADIFIKDGDCPGYNSEVWSVTYIFSEDTVIVMVSILDIETEKVIEKLMLNIPRDEVDKLLEDN